MLAWRGHHALGHAAGARGVDEAGGVVAPDRRDPAADVVVERRRPAPSPRARNGPRHGRAGRSSSGSMVMMAAMVETWSAAGMTRWASAAVETITASAPLLDEHWRWSSHRVRGIGRHSDGARGHDREIGDHPFRPVLRDQRRRGRRAAMPRLLRPRASASPARPPRARRSAGRRRPASPRGTGVPPSAPPARRTWRQGWGRSDNPWLPPAPASPRPGGAVFRCCTGFAAAAE